MKKLAVFVIAVIIILFVKPVQAETIVKFKDIKINFKEYWGKEKAKLIKEDKEYGLFVVQVGEKYFVVSCGNGNSSTKAGGLADLRFKIWLINKSGVPDGVTVNLRNARCQGTKFWSDKQDYIAMAIYTLSDDITIDGEKINMDKIIK